MGKKKYNGKVIIGLTENVTIMNGKEIKNITARIDTGATKSSIDSKLAASLSLGPIIKTRIIKSAHGHALRPIIKVRIRLAGIIIKKEFTVADRAHMKYKILIGQNILKKKFLIDPSKDKKKK